MPMRAAIVLALMIAAAQGPQPPATFRGGVELVQVDVVVVDRDGHHVTGLGATDFTIRDRGRPQAIATFDEVTRRPAAAAREIRPGGVVRDVSSNQTATADRLVVLFVDDLHIYKERSETARRIAGDAVTTLGGEASMAVLFTSGDHSTQVTDDPARLQAALDTLRGRQLTRRPRQAVESQVPGFIDPEWSSERKLAILQKASDAKLEDFFGNMALFRTLQDAARMLGAGDARRKAFVLISEGFGKNLSGLFGAMAPEGQPPSGGAAYAAGDVAATATMPPESYHDNALLQMMEAMRRANVTTYAIDPRGKVESGDLAHECFPAPSPGDDPCSNGFTAWNSPVRQAQQGLRIIAEASGGFAATDTDDFASGLDRVVHDLDHYYLLSFYPKDSGGKGYRRLDVQIAGHPEWTLRFRRGYLPGKAQPAAATDPLTALSAGILPATGLPLRLTAVALPGSGRDAQLVVTLQVSAPRARLQDPDGKLRDTLKYEVLLVNEKQAKMRAIAGREGSLTMTPVRGGEAPPDTVDYQVADVVNVPPGHYELRVSASSVRLGAGGSVYLPVDVPDFTAAAPVLSGVALDYADGPRVPAAPHPSPFRLPFLPSLDRAFAPEDTLRVYLEASGRAAGAWAPPSIDVLDASHRVVRSPSPSFTSAMPLRAVASIPLSGLPAGPYILRVTVAAGAATAVRETGFVVR